MNVKILPQSLFVCLTECCVEGCFGQIYMDTGLMPIPLFMNKKALLRIFKEICETISKLMKAMCT